jgi:CRISPR/Cas system CMR subunit Cmr6 (Cas7 group RAMP superfamily)
MHRSLSINRRINSTTFNDIFPLKHQRNDYKYLRSFDLINDHYEIRQIQQQFSIESPLTQPTNKNKLPYGKQKKIFY